MVRHVVPYIRVAIALFRIQLSDSKFSPLYIVAYNQAQSTLLHMIQSGSVCLPLLIGPNVAMNALLDELCSVWVLYGIKPFNTAREAWKLLCVVINLGLLCPRTRFKSSPLYRYYVMPYSVSCDACYKYGQLFWLDDCTKHCIIRHIVWSTYEETHSFFFNEPTNVGQTIAVYMLSSST